MAVCAALVTPLWDEKVSQSLGGLKIQDVRRIADQTGGVVRTRRARDSQPGMFGANAMPVSWTTPGLTAPALPAMTPVEETVAGIWSEVLGIAGLGVHEDFFELGGHSLLATQVVTRVRRALCKEVSLRLLFEARRDPAGGLEGGPGRGVALLVVVERDDLG